MSTTPRTDAAWNSTFIHNDVAKAANDLFIFARQLERELAEANQTITCLRSAAKSSDNARFNAEEDLARTINNMDLRDLIITTHPETPVV